MSDVQFKTQGEATSTAAKEVGYWLTELELAEKREKDWRKTAENASKIYETEKAAEHPFNILYSNTETLAPALYTMPPRPVVKRRYLDSDPIGAAGAKTIQRLLEFQIDTNEAEYDNFDDLMSQSLLQALVPGRGVVWWKFDADIQGGELPEGEESEAVEGLIPEAKGEKVVGELVEWSKFRHGFGRSWNKVPWVSREHVMTFDELKANFGSIASQVELSKHILSEDARQEEEDTSTNEGSLKAATVYEIWDKTEKKVIFISPGLKTKLLKKADDPHGLSSFFPCSRPLQFLRRIKRLEPICPYSVYQKQAEELNSITVRIGKIIKALKVRGFYDAQIEGIDLLLEQEDNKLVPADNVAALQQGRKLDDAIWLMPIEKLITVLQQLYMQREQIKQVIYEIMGIADILRGSSQASETATAQNLKNQWGSLRIKKWQRQVAMFARENLRLLAELSCIHLPVVVIKQMTGLPFVMPEEKQQAQMQMQQLQQQAQMIQPPMPGMPPDPAMQQQMQQMQQQAQQAQQIIGAIDWGQVDEIIKNETLREFRIDIETNSTLDPEATEDKQAIGEVLMAISQFFQSVGPLIQSGVFPFDAAKQMLLMIVRRYKMGSEVEGQLESMQPPPPPQGGEEAQKLLEERQKFEEDKQKAASELEKRKLELMSLQKELEFAKREAELEAAHVAKTQAMEQAMEARQAEMKLREIQQETINTITQKLQEHRMGVREEGQKQLMARQQEGQKQQAVQQKQEAKSKESGDAEGATQQLLIAALEKMAAALSAPRQLIRGPDGRAVGSEVVKH